MGHILEVGMDQRSFRSRQWSASFAPGRAANGKTTRLSPNGEIVPLGRRHSALASMRQIAGNCRRVRGTEREGSLSGVIAERGGRRHSRRRQEAAAAGGGRRRHRIGRMPFSFSRSLGHLICHVVSCKSSVLSIGSCHTTCTYVPKYVRQGQFNQKQYLTKIINLVWGGGTLLAPVA